MFSVPDNVVDGSARDSQTEKWYGEVAHKAVRAPQEKRPYGRQTTAVSQQNNIPLPDPVKGAIFATL